MHAQQPGSKEIQTLIDALHSEATTLRSHGVTDIADSFDRHAATLCVGPGGEIPFRAFAEAIHHYKGYIDEQPVCYSRSEWVTIVRNLQKLANSASQASRWSPSVLSSIKQTLWPF